MHYFISVYYNHLKIPRTEQLCKEFVARYPWVTLIEVAYGSDDFCIRADNSILIRLAEFSGFINNYLINCFITANIHQITSLSIIDCDLELPDGFYKQIIQKVSEHKGPTFIQGFSECSEKHISPKVLSPSMISSAKYIKETGKFTYASHTGYCYTYNRKFIDLIGKFPESLVLGSFDTFLHLSLAHNWEEIKALMQNQSILEELLTFYKAVKDVVIDYLPVKVYHNEHGNKGLRYANRMEMYKNISPEVIENYFKIRARD